MANSTTLVVVCLVVTLLSVYMCPSANSTETLPSGVERIHAHTALDATRFPTVHARHLDLLLKVLRALMDVGETIDGAAGQM